MSQEQLLLRGFRYKYGDRPLDGYTIQRGAGRGGFGEVYYAVSDSGREVALKVIQGYEQIELRGVSHCMNLKSPHLVTVFDVRHNDDGVPFVIMEFVAGPSLRQLLDESPAGLGPQKAAFFLREIGKGLAYLHDCGIVHRDLKPGNIFYENGYVKIGDYGLSKAMSTTQHSGQTITVGTVHYMAPEISMGRYDKSIDLYALGAILYEMLTGTPPYLGSSPGEILMKHMSAEPSLAGIEEPFASVIKKAMARDPKDRYQSVQEMVEAVFGAEHVRQSVSCFSPDSLSIVAQRVAQRAANGPGSATPHPLPPNALGMDAGDRLGQLGERFGRKMEALGDRMTRLGERFGRRLDAPGQHDAPHAADPSRDPLNRTTRKLLCLSTLVVVGMATTLFSSAFTRVEPGAILLLAFCATAGLASGMRLAHRLVLPRLASETDGMRRIILSGMGIAGMLLIFAPFIAAGDFQRYASGTFLGILAPLLFFNWLPRLAPDRRDRIEFSQAFVAGLVAFAISLVFNGIAPLAFGVVAGAALLVQVMSPWDPVAARCAQHVPTTSPFAPTPDAAMPDLQHPASPNAPTTAPRAAVPPPLPPSALYPPVPQPIRLLWLLAMSLLFSLGLMMLIYVGTASRIHEETFVCFTAFGVGFLLLSILCLCRGVQAAYTGWWRYLVKPLSLWSCAQMILFSAIVLGNVRLSDEGEVTMVFLIILFSILLITISFLRFGKPRQRAILPPPLPRAPSPAPANPAPAPVPPIASAPRPPMSTASSITVGAVLTHSRNFLLGSIGALLLLASIALALLAAIDLPDMIAAGLPDPHLRDQLAADVGPERVASVLELSLTSLTYLGFFLAVIFLMLARRWSGAAHVLRAALAIPILAFGLWILDHALPGSWPPANNMPLAIQVYCDDIRPVPVVFSALTILLGFATLIWPASRRTNTIPTTQEVAR